MYQTQNEIYNPYQIPCDRPISFIDWKICEPPGLDTKVTVGATIDRPYSKNNRLYHYLWSALQFFKKPVNRPFISDSDFRSLAYWVDSDTSLSRELGSGLLSAPIPSTPDGVPAGYADILVGHQELRTDAYVMSGKFYKRVLVSFPLNKVLLLEGGTLLSATLACRWLGGKPYILEELEDIQGLPDYLTTYGGTLLFEKQRDSFDVYNLFSDDTNGMVNMANEVFYCSYSRRILYETTPLQICQMLNGLLSSVKLVQLPPTLIPVLRQVVDRSQSEAFVLEKLNCVFSNIKEARAWHVKECGGAVLPHRHRINGAFTHPEDCGYIRYFRNADSLSTIKIKPGRYFKRFFPGLDNEVIKSLSAMYTGIEGSYYLEFITDGDEMQDAYDYMASLGTAKSCLCNKMQRTLKVFHESDVQLVIMNERLTGRPMARALVNKNTKQYPMIYGDVLNMRNLLDKSGYTHGGLDGARFKSIEVSHGTYLMPYIDGQRSLDRSNTVAARVKPLFDSADKSEVTGFEILQEGVIDMDAYSTSQMPDTNFRLYLEDHHEIRY